ncbi:hypothetical protein [Amycolatopsis suaedae]|uniref:hypothetical protein n=1 Tax=Amycolatopsis suaedae TaxID=2510978 RepID=UPI0013EF2F28|nr:hypothetical protein [Amycolatopsis suaedae]
MLAAVFTATVALLVRFPLVACAVALGGCGLAVLLTPWTVAPWPLPQQLLLLRW